MSRLNMDFNNIEDKMIEVLKQEYGFHYTSELIRFLILKTLKSFNKKENLNKK